MGSDPAFLFYPGDWLGGTLDLSFEIQGCYLNLLILQFNKGKFTEANAKHMLRSSFAVAWPELRKKFKNQGELYWNERLLTEIEKRKNYVESRRTNGSAPKKHFKKEASICEAYAKHTEDENRNEYNRELGGVGGKRFCKPTLEEVGDYCLERGNSVDPQAWLDHYESNGWKVGRNPMKDWKAAVRTWEKNDFRSNGGASKKGDTNGKRQRIDELVREETDRLKSNAKINPIFS